MRLLVVGSSDAFNSAGRGHSCYLLEEGGEVPLMVDFGATALKNLKSFGRDHRKIGIFCFTHLHGDHIGGFPFWLLDSTYNLHRTAPLEIVGPVGVEARLLELLRITFGDVADKPHPFRIRFTELRPGETVSFRGWAIQGFAADHMEPPDVPLCLRINDNQQASVAFSGDTQICDGLFDAANGADMLVCECSAMKPPAGRHCTWEEWTQNFYRLNTPRLLLTHLNDEMRNQAPKLKGPEDLDLIFADDGLELKI